MLNIDFADVVSATKIKRVGEEDERQETEDGGQDGFHLRTPPFRNTIA